MNAPTSKRRAPSRRVPSSIICSILLISIISIPVLANDAGSGADAGSSPSTATYLPANNSTYFGNLTQGSDTDDYYAINVTYGTGLAVTMSVPSNSDFDLLLLDSSTTQIDSSLNSTGQSEHVSSNGTNVGGTTVYIWIDQYIGSGQYTIQIDIFQVAFGSTGNDAGSGQDAGGSISTALPVNITTNPNFQGNLSSTNDDDWYSMDIPNATGVYIEMTHETGVDFDMWLYDSAGNQLDIAYTTNNPETVQSNGTDIGNSTVYLEIKDYASQPAPGSYNVSISLFSTIGNPAYSQNDGGSGGDAGNDVGNCTTLPIPQTSNSSSTFSGWISPDDDYDFYNFTVPDEYGTYVRLSTYQGMVSKMLLYLESSLTVIQPGGASSNANGDEYVTSNGTNVSGQDLGLRIAPGTESGFYNFTVVIFPLDYDGDGWYDEIETQCGTDPQDYNSTPTDFDSDGICDVMDEDDDDDGTPDNDDDFPNDPSETTDTDNDGVGNNLDEDDDGDGWNDTQELDCNSDPLSSSSTPLDTDGDSLCDELDDDDDGDGYLDSDDDFPRDDTEWIDTDNDGIGNNQDTNDDGDGFSDSDELLCGSNPLSYASVPVDTDSDGICDIMDSDDDGDGFLDSDDDFPTNPTEWVDTDSDGMGDNSDFDDDNDGVMDEFDAFDTDPSEQYDYDRDGLGDNYDADDDNDGWSDSDEVTCLSEPQNPAVVPDDFDMDYICDIMDPDDDGDGYDDEGDSFQFDATEWEDTDSDGIGNNQDDDDDDDGWSDIIEPNCGADPLNASSSPADTDNDGTCDFLDPDDDNDSVMDVDDDLPEDPNESKDTDGDGIGNNADLDDDDDGWSDSSEMLCDTSPLSEQSVPEDTDMDGDCDMLDTDDDNDGVPDDRDVFPKNADEWEDLNNDGLGDNGNPLSLIDNMKLSPGLSALAIFVLVSITGALIYSKTVSRKGSNPILDFLSKKQDSIEVSEPTNELIQKSTPPVPPGLEEESEKVLNYAKSWDELPPGGQYTDTVPMRYEGEDCGIWVQMDDESWVKN